MSRIIQLLGALAGTALGFALGFALLDRANELVQLPNAPAFLTPFLVTGFLFGHLLSPHLTIYPAHRTVERLDEAGAGE